MINVVSKLHRKGDFQNDHVNNSERWEISKSEYVQSKFANFGKLNFPLFHQSHVLSIVSV